MDISISVIIPVYNGESYIKKAITSALAQKETKEVLVINDGSTDQTDFIICQLSRDDDRVVLLYHTDKQNKGRAASRNLGIKKALQEYIAFLDADDYYLEDRFKKDTLIFNTCKDCEGVCNAIGAHFYRNHSPEERARLSLVGLSKNIQPQGLFLALLQGGFGHFSLDGLTLHRDCFVKAGLFNELFEVAEDTELIYRLALKTMLYTGSVDEAVAIRGVHDNNIFNIKEKYKTYDILVMEELLIWSSRNAISKANMDQIAHRLWLMQLNKEENIVSHCLEWSRIMLREPRLFFSVLALKYFPLIRKRKDVFPFFFAKRS